MQTDTALKLLVEEMHSAAVATVGSDGRPHIRTIDMMLYDDGGVYFLTAKGKEFYSELMAQGYVALSAVKDKRSVSLRGYVKNIGSEKLDEIFNKNEYMQGIYPEGTRAPLQVFCLYKGQGEYFDICVPTNIVRDSFFIGEGKKTVKSYVVTEKCIGCNKCAYICPQKCIKVNSSPVVIDRLHCLNCGSCAQICPVGAVEIQDITV